MHLQAICLAGDMAIAISQFWRGQFLKSDLAFKLDARNLWRIKEVTNPSRETFAVWYNKVDWPYSQGLNLGVSANVSEEARINQSYKWLELMSNCYKFLKSTKSEPYEVRPHRSPRFMKWTKLSLQLLTDFEHVVSSLLNTWFFSLSSVLFLDLYPNYPPLN